MFYGGLRSLFGIVAPVPGLVPIAFCFFLVLGPDPAEGDEGLSGAVASGKALDVVLEALALQRWDGSEGLGELTVEELGSDAVDEPIQDTFEGQEGVEGIAGTSLYGADGEADLKRKVLLFVAAGGTGGEARQMGLGQAVAVASMA
jgi:hypothetical protein